MASNTCSFNQRLTKSSALSSSDIITDHLESPSEYGTVWSVIISSFSQAHRMKCHVGTPKPTQLAQNVSVIIGAWSLRHALFSFTEHTVNPFPRFRKRQSGSSTWHFISTSSVLWSTGPMLVAADHPGPQSERGSALLWFVNLGIWERTDQKASLKVFSHSLSSLSWSFRPFRFCAGHSNWTSALQPL